MRGAISVVRPHESGMPIRPCAFVPRFVLAIALASCVGNPRSSPDEDEGDDEGDQDDDIVDDDSSEPIRLDASVRDAPSDEASSGPRDAASVGRQDAFAIPVGTDAWPGPDAGTDTARAGSSDASSGGCPGARALALCDGFEAATISQTRWAIRKSENLSLDESRARYGRRSLRVRGVNEKDGGGWLVWDMAHGFPAGLATGFYGRAFVWFAAPAPVRHMDFVAGAGPLDGSEALYRYGVENRRFTSNYFTIQGGRFIEGAIPTDRFESGAKPYDVPTGRWLCLEWRFDGANRRTQMWIDGVARPELAHDEARDGQSWPAPTFRAAMFGFQIYSHDDTGGAAFDLWFDEVAIDDQRIGCE